MTKILLVEDNPADVELIRAHLSEQNGSVFEIVHAKNLADGISGRSLGEIDLLLLDLGLPDSQGIQTVETARRHAPHLPIVVLTGLDDEETGIQALKQGAQDYLVKGQISGSTLARSIRYASERFRIEQELIQKNEKIFAAYEDLTAIEEELRQNLDELLRKEQELYSTALFPMQSPYPVMRADDSGIVVYANEASEPVLKRWNVHHQEALPDLLRDAVKESLARGTLLVMEERCGPDIYSITLRPIPDESYVNLYFMDVTERRRAEENLKQYAGKLKQSNEDLERFAYVASHDLQEPLRNVKSYTQLLARRYQGRLDDDADEFIRYIVEGTTRMQNLIFDLLEFSRVTSRGQPLRPTNLQDIYDNVVESLSLKIEDSGAEIAHDPLPVVMADATQMTQVLQNLLENAIKFRGAEPPRVWITARSNGVEWEFAVRDNGIGIDPQYHERIFTIFQRLHTQDKFPGTGIGLAIVKRIVERHGGRIWVESVPGKGTSFLFVLPAVLADDTA